MSDAPPTSQPIIFGVQSPHFKSTYTNTARFSLTPYDLTVVFGRQSDITIPNGPGAPGAIIDEAAIAMSLPFLKVLAIHLSHMVAEIEATVQPIPVPIASVENAQRQATALAKSIKDANLRP